MKEGREVGDRKEERGRFWTLLTVEMSLAAIESADSARKADVLAVTPRELKRHVFKLHTLNQKHDRRRRMKEDQ